MDYSKLMEQAAAYTQKFVDAAMPVAQKAYEIGLLTIQIDALQSIVLSIVGFIWCYVFYKLVKTSIRNNWAPEIAVPMYVLGGLVTIGSTASSVVTFFNIWLWVALFKPELWLAKQAIEKVLEVAK